MDDLLLRKKIREMVEIFRRHFRPLTPIPPDPESFEWLGPSVRQRPAWSSQIRAVLFDLYGTLWISASGQLEQLRNLVHREAIQQAMEAVGLRPARWSDEEAELLFQVIDSLHQRRRAEGVTYPEISIVEAWQRTLYQLACSGVLAEDEIQRVDVDRLVVECEARANPLWPMPGAEETLRRLRKRGYLLGIVSNAQFYTPLVFPALFGQEATELGLDPQLTFYSYLHGTAKPGLELFLMARQELDRRRIRPSQTLFVGNDMLHDIWPAHQVGFRTVLFAGDQRSLRLRAEDPRVGDLRPDAVITHLEQLTDWFDWLPVNPSVSS